MTKVLFEGPEDQLQVGDLVIPAHVETEVSEEVAERIKDHHGVTFLKVKTPPPTPPRTVTSVRGPSKED
jgi:hypothetical protein